MNSLGKPIVTGEMGLLLYEGGTVCDDHFDDDSANAICIEMGYLRFTSWRSDGDELSYGGIQDSIDITLDDVECSNDDWKACSYSTESHDCLHSEDVFLSCRSGNGKWKSLI